MIDLASFTSKYLYVPNVGDNSVNTGQCTGLVEVWLDANKQPHIYGNAKDLLANASLKSYKVFHNSSSNYPLPGSIVCWDSSWGNGDGHTAIVVAANPMHLVVFEQNNPIGHAPLVATHDYSGVLGWIAF